MSSRMREIWPYIKLTRAQKMDRVTGFLQLHGLGPYQYVYRLIEHVEASGNYWKCSGCHKTIQKGEEYVQLRTRVGHSGWSMTHYFDLCQACYVEAIREDRPDQSKAIIERVDRESEELSKWLKEREAAKAARESYSPGPMP